MGQCDVFWNGKPVGKASWSTAGREPKAEVRCWQSRGWIYRVVLFSGTQEVLRFGVLLPKEDCFYGSLRLQAGQIAALDQAEGLRGEVLRSRPEEQPLSGIGLPKSQFLQLPPEDLPLDPWIRSHCEEKGDLLYSLYCERQYLLMPMRQDGPDPLLPLYCTCRPVETDGQMYLCVLLDENGQVKPWAADEK